MRAAGMSAAVQVSKGLDLSEPTSNLQYSCTCSLWLAELCEFRQTCLLMVGINGP